MTQRQGTILKKCKCAGQERCSHKWTLRYWADGRQREMSFADELDGQGRPRYGSGKRLAQDAQLKVAHDKRARVFIDPKLGSARFRDECEKWITRHAGTELTKEAYHGILRAHVGPVLGDRTLAVVAQARDDVIDLLTIRLGEGSNSRRKIARALITGVLDEAVTAGKITMHRCGGITLPDSGGNGNHDDFVFPSHVQLLMLANGSEEPAVRGVKHPLAIWLMRGSGLRIEEALAVQKSCFRENGTVLRVFEQASRDGRKTRPLKHRKAGEYRDTPGTATSCAVMKSASLTSAACAGCLEMTQPSGRFHRCTCLCPSPVSAGSARSKSVRCRFRTCRPVYRGFARIAATVRSVHAAPVRCGFRPGSAADGHGTPASFKARVIRAALCPASRCANIHVTTGAVAGSGSRRCARRPQAACALFGCGPASPSRYPYGGRPPR